MGDYYGDDDVVEVGSDILVGVFVAVLSFCVILIAIWLISRFFK